MDEETRVNPGCINESRCVFTCGDVFSPGYECISHRPHYSHLLSRRGTGTGRETQPLTSFYRNHSISLLSQGSNFWAGRDIHRKDLSRLVNCWIVPGAYPSLIPLQKRRLIYEGMHQSLCLMRSLRHRHNHWMQYSSHGTRKTL
jgi:hypothetical protein